MAATCEWVDLGDGLRGYYGRPDGNGPFPGVIVYIEAFGVNNHFQGVTQRFADAGYATITPDIYDGAIYEYTDLDNAIGHLKRLDDDKVMAQTQQCLDFLGRRPEADASRVGVTGFCMGGRLTFLANAVFAGKVKAAASFYGGGIGPIQDGAGRKVLLDRIPEMQTPITFWYGAEDQSIKPDELGRIAEAMAAAKKRFTMTVFPDAGHGFFCEDRASYNQEAADVSWRGTLHFFGAHLGH